MHTHFKNPISLSIITISSHWPLPLLPLRARFLKHCLYLLFQSLHLLESSICFPLNTFIKVIKQPLALKPKRIFSYAAQQHLALYSPVSNTLSLSSPKHCKPLIFLTSVPFQSSLIGSFPLASFQI